MRETLFRQEALVPIISLVFINRDRREVDASFAKGPANSASPLPETPGRAYRKRSNRRRPSR